MQGSVIPTSENPPSETVRKGVLETLQGRLWLVYGGLTGAKSPSLAARRATLQAPPRLFGQFLRECLENPNGLNSKALRGGITGPKAPLSALGVAKNT